MSSIYDSEDKENVVRTGLGGSKPIQTNLSPQRLDKRTKQSKQVPYHHTAKMRRFTSTMNKSSGLTISEVHHLRQQINEKEREIDSLNTSFISLRTQVESQTLNNFTVESKYLQLERQLKELKSNVEKLNNFEESSMRELQHKFEISSQEMMVKHKERLNSRKEEIATEIDKILQEKQSKYLNAIEKLNANLKSFQEKKESLGNEFQQRLELARQEFKDREKALQENLQQVQSSNEETSASIKHSIDSLRSKINDLTDKSIPSKQKEYAKYESIAQQLKSKNSDKQAEIDSARSEIQSKSDLISELDGKAKLRNDELSRMKFEIKRMKMELVDQETKRRKLHAQLQDLKGNIRVFCRIRAVAAESKLIKFDLPDEDLNEDAKQELSIVKENVGIFNSANSYKFQFDKIFSMNHENECIFEEYSQLIQSCIDGSNVCVFAYGQTGSGKTFTMSHPVNGMIPLSIKKVFDDIKELDTQEQQWEYEINGKFIEIYNENIIDLLNPQSSEKHEIKHDDVNCKTTITNITTVPITSPSQANSILEQVNKRRSTAATKSNDKSSRSHSIFIIDIKGSNKATGVKTFGTLNLIDLAGSERISVSQVEGDRLKETQAINKSLSAVGDVISSLNLNQGSHIPYRNSKLTYLLKHSLGGNSKTLMFVNISPLSANFNETINSLRFATKVNSTKLG
ncbi:KAR3 [Candida theae]|uniref:Kinesin-like protein n=1 Tax=Candida theae TaxID=1198502 RepID=A0AAD5BCI0_9ASCO|nr:KAR3 [Candida theae]KAI5953738.1 KAR3 [Candida theae]